MNCSNHSPKIKWQFDCCRWKVCKSHWRNVSLWRWKYRDLDDHRLKWELIKIELKRIKIKAFSLFAFLTKVRFNLFLSFVFSLANSFVIVSVSVSVTLYCHESMCCILMTKSIHWKRESATVLYDLHRPKQCDVFYKNS